MSTYRAHSQLVLFPRLQTGLLIATRVASCRHVESAGGWADHVHSLKAMIDEVVAEHQVDVSRIYLT